MDQGPLAVLTTDVFDASDVTFAGRRTRVVVLAWRALLAVTLWAGIVARFLLVDCAAVISLLVAIAVVLLGIRDLWTAVIVVTGGWVFVLLFLTSLGARQRVLIGEFRNMLRAEGQDEAQSPGADTADKAPGIDLADLLLGEVSRIVDLFHVVGDQRAVSSGLGSTLAFDAAMSADGLLGTLRGAVSPDSKVTVGPVTLPVAPVVALLGTVMKAPRLTGGLHRDGTTLILTAEMSRRQGLTWIITNAVDTPAEAESVEPSAAPAAAGEDAIVMSMVHQMSLRIFTDVALGRSVRWSATKSFVSGLQAFRVCLRTPRDRKVNLKIAEEKFLKALAEDEDFPLGHYNLGVVYTELHGLAVAAGRDTEAEAHLRAAETAFGRAIEKDPTRWETYFAFAQTQFQYRRYEQVLELVRGIQIPRRRSGDRAKVAELEAQALRMLGRSSDATARARFAARESVRALAWARLLRRGSREDDTNNERICRELAARCMLTFGSIYSAQMTPGDQLTGGRLGRWRKDRILRRSESIFRQARRLTRRDADVRFGFGLRVLRHGRLDLAVQELEAALRSQPTRATFSSGLALALASRNLTSTQARADRDLRVRDLCWNALEAMATAYSPSRDGDAIEIMARAFAAIGRDDLAARLRQLETEFAHVEERAKIEALISACFLEFLEQAGVNPTQTLGRGQFVRAIAGARERLNRFQRAAPGGPVVLAVRSTHSDDLREALMAADRATSLNPLSAQAWETLGDVYRALSDFGRARTAWQNALAADPDNPTLYNKIGWSFWYPAFEKAARVSSTDLSRARAEFRKALRLYGTQNFEDQVLTHYRLGKLNALVRDFANARSELRIVEDMDEQPPIVGWVQLGLAYLERDHYPECEHFMDRAVDEGERLRGEGHDLAGCVGDPIDEWTWPLGLALAWGHLGLAFSLNRRDGDVDVAAAHVKDAQRALVGLDPRLYPSRASSACESAAGQVAQRQNNHGAAIQHMRASINGSPHSAAYIDLALELWIQSGKNRTSPGAQEARQLLRHARTLRPADAPSRPINDAFALVGDSGD